MPSLPTWWNPGADLMVYSDTAYSFNASSIPLSRGGGVKNKSEDECAPSQSLWHWFKEGYQDALVCKD